jgi:hypothetical protein
VLTEDQWPGYIRRLLYPVLFEADPVNGLDRVLTHVVYKRGTEATPQDYLAAIRLALASEQALVDLLPQRHTEETIRRFLSALQRRLEEDLRE